MILKFELIRYIKVQLKYSYNTIKFDIVISNINYFYKLKYLHLPYFISVR